MEVKDLYNEAIQARRNMGIVGGDITLLMNTLIMLKIYDKLDELKPIEIIEELKAEEKPKKKV